MRIANIADRLCIVAGEPDALRAVDVEQSSGGRFAAAPQAIYDQWDDFVEWAQSLPTVGGVPFSPADLGSPTPWPRQIFAVGLNYRAHADESGFARPETEPPIFTKFASSITGPYATVELPAGGHTDWEVELVAVIGRTAVKVAENDALSYLAGYTIGQDLSERILQMAATPPQFSLGKSFPGFAPMGPWLVTLDEFADPADLGLRCAIDGEEVQSARTTEMIFPVAALVAKLSAAVTLLPGDVIFTGTPSGVGLGRSPQRWLGPGEVLVSEIESIGAMCQQFR
jgi:2-keto-4-pentenoate hydratase/2-oxohepta-3-ene-1,7-dioic acid hydratase in catechol pathway